jgi:NADH-quinone oxidoreductase subunit M
MPDLSAREWLILAPLALLTIIIGLHPAPLLDTLAPAVQAILGGQP